MPVVISYVNFLNLTVPLTIPTRIPRTVMTTPTAPDNLTYLFETLEQIATTSGRNAKLEKLIELLNSPVSKYAQLMYQVGLDPLKPTYIGKFPNVSSGCYLAHPNPELILMSMLEHFDSVPGNIKKADLQDITDSVHATFSELGQKWIKKCLTKDWTLGTSISSYNKAAGLSEHVIDEIFEFDTVRVSEVSACTINPIGSFVGIKKDGVNSTLDYVNVSRNGNLIALPHIEAAIPKALMDQYVFFGELVSSDRQSSSGLCNSAIKLGYESTKPLHKLVLHVFDVLPRSEYMSKQFSTTFRERVPMIKALVEEINHPAIDYVRQHEINSTSELYEFFDDCVDQDEEGLIWNDGGMLFELNRSTMRARIKEVMNADFKVVGYKPHLRYPDRIGSIEVETADGLLRSSVGTGLSDQQRIDFMKSIEQMIADETVVKVHYNKVVPDPDRDGCWSLFIPVFKQGEIVRIDKTVADNITEIEFGGKKKKK